MTFKLIFKTLHTEDSESIETLLDVLLCSIATQIPYIGHKINSITSNSFDSLLLFELVL